MTPRKIQVANGEVKIFTIRISRSLWEQMMRRKIITGKSMNTQIAEAIEQYVADGQ